MKKLPIKTIVILGFLCMLALKIAGDRKAVERAENYIKQGDYATAYRLLYNQAGWSKTGQQAAKALNQIEWELLHDDRSEVMQYFRDPTHSLLEKDQVISEIVKLLDEKKPAQHPLLKNQNDPFVRLMLSSRVPSDERTRVILRVGALVEQHYVSLDQQQELKNQVFDLQAVAEEQLQRGDYLATFHTLREADELAGMLPYFDKDILPILWKAVERYLQYDDTPLTVLLRDPDVSFLDKRMVLTKLQHLIYTPDKYQEIMIHNQAYTGSFIEIIPQVGGTICSQIWVALKDALEYEADYFGDTITTLMAQSAFPEEKFRPIFPQSVTFDALHIGYHSSSVTVFVYGTIPRQDLKTLYSSVGFTSKMFRSNPEYGERAPLTSYWNVTLHDVQFANLKDHGTKERGWSACTFAYQEGESGKIQFFILFVA